MNLYIVVEGKGGERILYPFWISYVNSKLKKVSYIDEISDNCYYLISGNGYPQYLGIIDAAIEDVKDSGRFDQLVVAVDAEEYTFEEKRQELVDHISGKIALEKVKIIIQYPCLETWALGNRIVYRKHPQGNDLRRYLKLYDVRTKNPELLPANTEEGLNRCQFAYKYLKAIISERYDHLVYTKGNPKVLMHEKYFEQITKRLRETGHIASFRGFMDCFGEK